MTDKRIKDWIIVHTENWTKIYQKSNKKVTWEIWIETKLTIIASNIETIVPQQNNILKKQVSWNYNSKMQQKGYIKYVITQKYICTRV